MNIALTDLDKVVSWIKKNTTAVKVDIKCDDYFSYVLFSVRESNGQVAEIKVFTTDINDNGLLIPKITRTDNL